MKPESKAKYIARLDELASRLYGLDDLEGSHCREIVDGCFLGAINVINFLYGPTSPQIKELTELKKTAGRMKCNEKYKNIYFAYSLRGCLTNAKEEIENDLIESIEAQVSGEIIGNADNLRTKCSTQQEGELKVSGHKISNPCKLVP